MTDPISAELERALFRRFWAWLGIVGTLIIAAVTAVSVLVSQVLLLTAKSSSEEAAQRELAQLSNKISFIDSSSVEAAKKAAVNQASAEASAIAAANRSKQAEEAVATLSNAIETSKAVATSVGQVQTIADLIATKPEFVQIITNNLLKLVNARLDALTRGGVLAAGVIQGGRIIYSTAGVSFDLNTGRVSFQNPYSVKFIPILTTISPNATYATGACFHKEYKCRFIYYCDRRFGYWW
jgi:hypothetical protein